MTASQTCPPRHRLLVPGAAAGVIAAVVAATALTACSSGSQASAGSSSVTSSAAGSSSAVSSSVSSAAPTTTAPTTAATSSDASDPTASAHLAEQLAAGVRGITSVHLTGVITSGSTTNVAGTIAADEKLNNGKVTAIDLSEKISGQTIRLILIGTKAWAKLPTSTGAKPWLKVSTTSTNPTIRAVATSLASTSSQTSLDGLVSFAKAASDITTVGKTTVDGVPTTRYTMTVVTAKLPAASGKALVALGVKSVPTQMWIDAKGRPVRVSEKVTASTISTTTTLDLTKYNQPVSVTPPPAAQVGG